MPHLFQPLPGLTVDRSASYRVLLRGLLGLVGVEPPTVLADEPGARWYGRAREAVAVAVTRRAEEASKTRPVPEEWFEPLVSAAVHEPNPSFNRQLVEPAIDAFSLRRVQAVLIDYIETGAPADAAGAANAWYWTETSRVDADDLKPPTPVPATEAAALSDLRQRYRHSALRRFITEEDLDARRNILPGLPLVPQAYPAEMHDLVAQAVQIARTSTDTYLKHRVEIQTSPCSQ